MKHPGVTDICDVARILFPWFPTIAFELTAIMLLLNNVMLVGFHVFTGAKSEFQTSATFTDRLVLNTLSDSSQCTVVFQAITAIIGSKSSSERSSSRTNVPVIFSLPRTFNHVSTMGIVSAICMAIAIILSLVYAGIEANPLYGYGGNYPTQGPVQTSVGVPGDPGFVNGMNAVLK